jgi:hypothetical protein
MTSIQVILNGDGSTKDLHERGMKAVHLGNGAPPIRLTYLSGLAEVSAALLVQAAALVKAKAQMEGFDL